MVRDSRKKAEKVWEDLMRCTTLPPDDDFGEVNCMLNVLKKHRIKKFEFADDGSDVEIKLPSGEKYILILEPGNPSELIRPIGKRRRRK